MRDGSKLHTFLELLEDDKEENPHTVAVKLPAASYFPCREPEVPSANLVGQEKIESVEQGHVSLSATHENHTITAAVAATTTTTATAPRLRIDSHVFTVPAISHSGRHRKYASFSKHPVRVAFVRTDSVLFLSPSDDHQLFAYLSNRNITTTRTDVNNTDTKGKKKRWTGAAASESIEGTQIISITLLSS